MSYSAYSLPSPRALTSAKKYAILYVNSDYKRVLRSHLDDHPTSHFPVTVPVPHHALHRSEVGVTARTIPKNVYASMGRIASQMHGISEGWFSRINPLPESFSSG
jgi:hypothetical protein